MRQDLPFPSRSAVMLLRSAQYLELGLISDWNTHGFMHIFIKQRAAAL